MSKSLLAALIGASLSAAVAADNSPSTGDAYQWLEDVTGEQAMNWVKQQNAISQEKLTQSPAFTQMKDRLLAVMNSNARIPYVGKMGDYYYNFWRDAANPRGVWRRTTLDEYRKAEPKWEVILDLDVLGKSENENWVWKGSDCLYPEYKLCLISLSRGGADATVVREFNLAEKQFVKNGFQLPESKGAASWYDENALIIGRDFGAGSLTDSGYPRISKLWKRGSDLAKAEVIYEGKQADVWVYGGRDHTKGFEREYVQRGTSFYTNETFYRHNGKLVKIDKQDDASVSAYREWMLFTLKSDWTVGGKTWPSGAVLITRFDDFMAGKRDFEMLFTPGARKSLAGLSFTKNFILLNELENVRNRVYVLSHKNGKWMREAMQGLPEFGTVSVSAVDDEESDDYWLNISDYTTPSQYLIGSIGKGKATLLKQLPSFFNAEGLQVAQHEATSKDGTKVPYFMVSRKDMKLDGKNPTLLYGYGGFQVSLTPGYNASAGIAWLEKGGVYVVANIRGGGEFGPAWHQAALKANRNKAYEDFIAVGEDLVKRKITSSKHLGIQGGSNGGLLMGNMLTMRPDLWGAVVCQVPLLDMQRYNKLLAGASWMAEYGNPDVPSDWSFLKQYSPYHNLKTDVTYPAVLFTTSTRDDRVHPGHARKMAAKMLGEHNGEVLYYENIEGGHGGAANNEQSAFMTSLAYAFLWQQLSPR